ncbi:AMP-binding protein [Corynebacterium falsenii]|uniref:AMP-binding protein n=1 Tax=Corynebacterium falsenii TaxID=108486 RepID=UPI00234DBA59|nr:AMP-binding protein [Corynebacterium falsenii]MDC7104191.1 AMP-binding protein [Corynebacterium falsenii]
MTPAHQQPKLTLAQQASNARNLVAGAVPLVKSGVLGGMTPAAAGKALQGMYQWRLLSAGLLAIGAGRNPFHTAIIDDAGSMTYEELHEQTNSLARALFRTGIRERDRIGVLCRNHRGLILALCAHGRLGTDIVFFNTGASAEQTRAVANEQKLDVLFIDEEFLPLLPKDFDACPVIIAWENGDTLGLTRDAEAALDAPSNVRDAIDSGDFAERSPDWATLQEIINTTPDHLTIPSRPRMGRTIILTSGTTGTPKGARRPEPRTYMPASSIMSKIPLKHHRPVFLAAPMFHTWGFAQIQLALALRNTMILQRRFSPKAAVKVIEKNKPYTIAMVPTMLRKLLEAIPEGFNPGTKIIATSGEALPPKVIRDTQEKFGDVLYNLYGSTEVSWASIATPQELRDHPRTAGKPPLATTLKIIDDDGNELPEGQIGRIFVKNDMLFEGYTRPGADKDTIDGMVATGDLGYYEDGLLYVSGRSDDMIVSGGENVFPQETEDVLTSMDEVAEAAVRGVEDPEFGQALCAWVVLDGSTSGGRSSADLSDADNDEFIDTAKAAVKKKLARHSVPRYFVFLDALPRNAVGKVVPRELPQP